MRRVLVTGGAGFIGRVLATRLAGDGYQVAAVDRKPGPDIAGLASYFRVDLADRDKTESVFDTWRPDAVVHLASIVSVPDSVGRPRKIVENNIGATMNVLESANAYGVGRVVFTSTCAVYGDAFRGGSLVQEVAPAQPRSPYGAVKFFEENLIRQMMETAVILRLGNVFSHLADPSTGCHGVITDFRGQMLKGEPVTIFGGGDGGLRDYIHVYEVCKAITKGLECKDADGGVFNVGTGIGTSVRELEGMMREACPCEVGVPVDGEPRGGDVDAVVLDTQKARAVLGFKPWAGNSLEKRITAGIFD